MRRVDGSRDIVGGSSSSKPSLQHTSGGIVIVGDDAARWVGDGGDRVVEVVGVRK